MSQPSSSSSSPLSLRGAVDLAAVAAQAKRRQQAATAAEGGAGAPGGTSSGLVVDVTEEQFQTVVVDRSLDVPVVVDLWAEWCEPCKQLSPVLEQLAHEYGGRFLLAKVDVDANPRLGQVFQAQSIPMVVAVVKGQPVPLFQGALPEAQVRAYLDELLRVAEANGVTGRLPVGDTDGEGEQVPQAPAEPPLPPLHQEAYDAIERGDLAAAATAYEQALAQAPADAEARAGLAQVNLMRRTDGVDLATARAAAADAPGDPAAQILVADLDLLGGHVDDAFARLVDTVRTTAGDEREQVRAHLVELFEVVGGDDPRVQAARRALSAALF
ncbi:tetratricopeptide repeat protein [Angustibacter peucedani]